MGPARHLASREKHSEATDPWCPAEQALDLVRPRQRSFTGPACQPQQAWDLQAAWAPFPIPPTPQLLRSEIHLFQNSNQSFALHTSWAQCPRVVPATSPNSTPNALMASPSAGIVQSETRATALGCQLGRGTPVAGPCCAVQWRKEKAVRHFRCCRNAVLLAGSRHPHFGRHAAQCLPVTRGKVLKWQPVR